MRAIGKRNLGNIIVTTGVSYKFTVVDDMVIKTYSDIAVMSYPFQRVPAPVSDASKVYMVDDRHIFVVNGSHTDHYLIDNFVIRN